ncbi:MAG: hypothetical protein NVS2B16_17010 [Chloroflexota bacterium]
MKVFILGCGRVGAGLASVLGPGYEVTVMDWNETAFDRLPENFSGSTVTGNGIDVDALRSAGVDEADTFFALTNGDNRNLVAAQIARGLGVERAIVRVYDPVRCQIFANMGLTTYSPTVNGAQALFHMVLDSQEGA